MKRGQPGADSHGSEQPAIGPQRTEQPAIGPHRTEPLRMETQRTDQHWNRSKRHLKTMIKDESGSAILEFIMIALPLFVPLALYLNSIQSTAQGLADLQNIARQVARAYTTSPTEDLALVRANQVLSVYQNQILPIHGDKSVLSLQIICEAQPCLTPNAKVIITVLEAPSGRNATATQVVDAWRSSG